MNSSSVSSISGEEEPVEFTSGDLVLAHVKGHPFWPAKVTHVIENNLGKKPRFFYRVIFFETDEEANLPAPELRPYNQAALSLFRPRKSKVFNSAIYKIEKEVQQRLAKKRQVEMTKTGAENDEELGLGEAVVEPGEYVKNDAGEWIKVTMQTARQHVHFISREEALVGRKVIGVSEDGSTRISGHIKMTVPLPHQPQRVVPVCPDRETNPEGYRRFMERKQEDERRQRKMAEECSAAQMSKLMGFETGLKRLLKANAIDAPGAVRLLDDIRFKSNYFQPVGLLNTPSFVHTIEKISRMFAYPEVVERANAMMNAMGIYFCKDDIQRVVSQEEAEKCREHWLNNFYRMAAKWRNRCPVSRRIYANGVKEYGVDAEKYLPFIDPEEFDLPSQRGQEAKSTTTDS